MTMFEKEIEENSNITPEYYVPSFLPQGKQHFWSTIDSTKLQSFCACPRQFFYNYILGWREEVPSNHLVFGRAWHKALEHLYSKPGWTTQHIANSYAAFIEDYRKTFGPETDNQFGAKTPARAAQALIEYANQNFADAYLYEIGATEVIDNVAIPETLQPLTVKLDMVLQNKETGEVAIMEHKTGSSGGQFWARQWHTSIQVGAYIYACYNFYGYRVPCIVDGTFFLKTKINFQREIIDKSSQSLQNWLKTIQALIEDMNREFDMLCTTDSPSERVMNSYPMHPTACSSYTGCQYYDLCTCVGNPLQLYDRNGGKPPVGYVENWWDPTATED